MAKINLSRMDFESLVNLRKQVEDALVSHRSTLEKSAKPTAAARRKREARPDTTRGSPSRQPNSASRPGLGRASPRENPDGQDGWPICDPAQWRGPPLSDLRQAAAGQSGCHRREQAPWSGACLHREKQKELDMSRSAKAPRRRGQRNHMFKVG